MRSSLLLVGVIASLLSLVSGQGTHTISAPCFGYSVDGSACTANGGPSFSLEAGSTTTFVLSDLGSHPLVFSNLPGSLSDLSTWATPNAIAGQTSTTVTLTIPSTAVIGSNLYYVCAVHLFYGTITIVAAGSLGSSGTLLPSSTGTVITTSTGTVATLSSSSGIISLFSSTGGSSTPAAFTHYITAPCFGYSLDSSDCIANGGPSLSLARGYTYYFVLGDLATPGHPLAFVTATGAVSATNLYGDATPNLVGGMSSTTVTLTIPASTAVGTKIFYECVPHQFYGTITVVDDTFGSTGINAAPGFTRPVLALFAMLLSLLVVITA